MPTFPKKAFIKIAALGLFLIIWSLAASLVGEALLLPAPLEVGQTLLQWMSTPSFYKILAATFIRGAGGFLLSFISALILGILASSIPTVGQILQPFIVTIRSIPLLALILLAILWFRLEQIPYFVVYLILFPLIFGNVLEGAQSVDPQLLEMSSAFGLSPAERIRHITIPHLTPYLLSAISSGLGVAWKAVIAAEILTMPALGIGTAMQRAQLELNSEALFAWTLALLLMSGICEFLIQRSKALQPWRRDD